MPKYVAFLRAINVGRRVVKMDALRRHFAELNFQNVETFIASGNVIFDAPAKTSPALIEIIQQQLAQKLGFEVDTFLRTPDELQATVAEKVFTEWQTKPEGRSLYVAFLAEKPTATAKRAVQQLAGEADALHFVRREMIWLSRKSISKSEITGAKLEKALGAPITMRNANTVHKLAAKYNVG